MEPRIEAIPEKKMIGKRMAMTLANNRTFELWHSFMVQRHRIKNTISSDLISMQVYDKSLDFKDFNMDTCFEKWAATEVTDFDSIPDEMEAYTLAGGLYAVFLYKGDPGEFAETFQFIFKTWLPKSGYCLDQREHFELLGEKYKNGDSNSEEEIWVPVKPKLFRL